MLAEAEAAEKGRAALKAFRAAGSAGAADAARLVEPLVLHRHAGKRLLWTACTRLHTCARMCTAIHRQFALGCSERW